MRQQLRGQLHTVTGGSNVIQHLHMSNERDQDEYHAHFILANGLLNSKANLVLVPHFYEFFTKSFLIGISYTSCCVFNFDDAKRSFHLFRREGMKKILFNDIEDTPLN